MLLPILLSPNASRTQIVGWIDGALKIKLAAPPVDGKANEALINFLAKEFKVPKSSIILKKGHTGKRKLVEIPLPPSTLEQLKKGPLFPSKPKPQI